ncbi:MAG: GGDEF domain-containing protein, partial [Eggerthellaceae bacterium]|nr:GGDEF domain-containing protein [Eggerthellaceae bacterium]
MPYEYHYDDTFRSRIDSINPLVRDIPESSLGPFGNVPAAYAVFQIDAKEGAERAERVFFLYASPEYCRLANCKLEDIQGISHLEVVKSESEEWPVQCYRAATQGETFNGMMYSPLVEGWISYNVGPSPVEDCIVFAFVPVDSAQQEHQVAVDSRTTEVVSAMLRELTGEKSYDAAMNDMLTMTAGITGANRVCVFECNGAKTTNTFEWCADGVAPQLGSVSDLPSDVLKAWFKSAVKDPVALIPDTSILARFSPPLHEWCVESDIHSLMAAPFYNEGDVVGFLGAYNYHLDETVDINRVFSAISSFVGARIDNHRLIETLAWASEHDTLTELYNRRGADAALAKALEGHEGAPLAVVTIDLDDLKMINDRFGHIEGDLALPTVAKAMRQAFPISAILSRFGGDEFFAGLIGDDALRADELVKNLADSDMKYEHAGNVRSISVSIGYALIPDQAADIKDAYQKADEALYAVKHASKNG